MNLVYYMSQQQQALILMGKRSKVWMEKFLQREVVEKVGLDRIMQPFKVNGQNFLLNDI